MITAILVVSGLLAIGCLYAIIGRSFSNEEDTMRKKLLVILFIAIAVFCITAEMRNGIINEFYYAHKFINGGWLYKK